MFNPIFASQFVPNRVLIEVNEVLATDLEELPSPSLLNLGNEYQLRRLFYKPYDSQKQEQWYLSNLDKWYILDWEKDFADPTSKLINNKNILKVTKDIIGEIALTPDDYGNYDIWALDKMNCEAAWDIHSTAEDIVIAIIDTGIEPDHEDIADQLWINPVEDLNGNGIWDESDVNGIDDDLNGFIDDFYGYDFVSITADQISQLGIEPVDGQDYAPADNEVFPDYVGHGTFCAGIAGASTNNSVGVSSVSGGSTLMPVRVAFPVTMNGQQTGVMTMSDFAAGVQYAADNGADVISMSLASPQVLPAVETALNYAYAFAILSVAGAGNASQSLNWYPAAYENVISVAATDRNDHLATFSCYGTTIDLCAPGVDIISTTPGYGLNPSIYTGHNGTSASTPFIAGAIALLMASEPSLNPFTIDDRLAEACVNIDSLNPGYDGLLGAGRLDVNLLLGGTNEVYTESDKIPQGFSVADPYPNPFNSMTRFSIILKHSQNVRINVYDLCGREVKEIANRTFFTGSHDLTFDASGLPNGVYFIKSEFSGGEILNRVTLIK